jgi:hypothetical protein
MNINYSLIIIIIIIKLYNDNSNQINEYFTTNSIQSHIDNRIYNVVGGFTDKQEAANKLSLLHGFMIKFMKYIKTKYIIKRQNVTDQEYKFVTRILNNYRPDTLVENNPLPGEETSYILNKGDKFGVCLRIKHGVKKNQFHEIDILQFVLLHEITHLGTLTYGHNEEFWHWFKFILHQAKNSGLYNPVDYKKYPETYCGISVASNPYFL